MNRNRQGQAPYGYRWQAGELVAVPEEARIRRQAFELVLSLRSSSGVAKELNARNLPTRRGGEWSDVQVARILSCHTAIGVYRMDTAAGGGDTVNCEPILSEDVWNRVQAILKSRSKRKANRFEENSTKVAPALFAGLLLCACGKPLGQSAGKGQCANCGGGVPMAELETVFASDFYDLISSIPDLAPTLCEQSDTRAIHLSLADYRHRLTVARAKRDSIERLLSDRAISRKRFEETHPPVEREIRDLETRIRHFEEQLPPARTGSLPQIGPAEWLRLWASWPVERRRQIIQTFVDHITVRPGEIEIAYLLSDFSSKETDPIQQISHPTFQAQTGQPRYIRLPKPGEKCPITGLSRAKLNELILPNERNNFAPPVASKSLRQKGAQRGIRLVLLESLMAYLSGKI